MKKYSKLLLIAVFVTLIAGSDEITYVMGLAVASSHARDP